MTAVGEQIIAHIRAKVAEDPEYRYEEPDGADQCMYVHKGAPSCLVGHGLWEAKLIDASFEASRDVWSWTRPNFQEIRKLASILKLSLSDDEIAWLEVLQRSQDQQSTWGTALDDADEMVTLG